MSEMRRRKTWVHHTITFPPNTSINGRLSICLYGGRTAKENEIRDRLEMVVQISTQVISVASDMKARGELWLFLQFSGAQRYTKMNQPQPAGALKRAARHPRFLKTR